MMCLSNDKNATLRALQYFVQTILYYLCLVKNGTYSFVEEVYNDRPAKIRDATILRHAL